MVMLAIAITFAAMGAKFPQYGGMIRYACYSNGALIGLVAASSNWISIISAIPIEAVSNPIFAGQCERECGRAGRRMP